MCSNEIAIGQIVGLRSLLRSLQCVLDLSSQMTLCDPVLNDVARGIDEPSVQVCQRIFPLKFLTVAYLSSAISPIWLQG